MITNESTIFKNGAVLTPVEQSFSEQVNQFQQLINTPEYQNYTANQMQEKIKDNIVDLSVSNIKTTNPNEKTERLLSESNAKQDKQIQLLEKQLEQEKISNTDLQLKLEDAYTQLRQLNDKESSQNLYIKELKADLKEESLKRELAENKVSAKDWKLALIAGVIGLVAGLVSSWFGFYLTTL